jgi:hypothetical protein
MLDFWIMNNASMDTDEVKPAILKEDSEDRILAKSLALLTTRPPPFALGLFNSLMFQQIYNDPGYLTNKNPQTHQCLLAKFKFFCFSYRNQTIAQSFYLV